MGRPSDAISVAIGCDRARERRTVDLFTRLAAVHHSTASGARQIAGSGQRTASEPRVACDLGYKSASGSRRVAMAKHSSSHFRGLIVPPKQLDSVRSRRADVFEQNECTAVMTRRDLRQTECLSPAIDRENRLDECFAIAIFRDGRLDECFGIAIGGDRKPSFSQRSVSVRPDAPEQPLRQPDSLGSLPSRLSIEVAGRRTAEQNQGAWNLARRLRRQ